MLQLSTYTVQQGKLGRKKKKRDKQRKTMRSINQKQEQRMKERWVLAWVDYISIVRRRSDAPFLPDDEDVLIV